MHSNCSNIWNRNLESYESLGTKTSKYPNGNKRIMFGITWRDRKRASWAREQTKVEYILTTIKE